MHENANDEMGEPVLVVRSMDTSLRIVVEGPASGPFLTAFRQAWGHLVDETGVPADHTLLLRADDHSARGLAAAVERATHEITLALIDLNAGAGALFHAAAILDADGTAALLVGASGAGKTTAAIRLGRANGYLTDETALVNADGHVANHPKPLSIVSADAHKAQVPPAELGLPVPGEPLLPVGRLLVLNRAADDAGSPRSEHLDLASAVLAVVPEISRLDAVPRPLVALATLIASVGGAERLTYRDAEDFDAGLLPARPEASMEAVWFSQLDPSGARTHEGRGFVRAPASDAIQTSTVLLVAHGSTVTALDGIAVSLWHETAREQTRDELLAALRDRHGRRDGDGAIVDEALRQLVGARVLSAPTTASARDSGDRAHEKSLSKGPLG